MVQQTEDKVKQDLEKRFEDMMARFVNTSHWCKATGAEAKAFLKAKGIEVRP